MRLDHIDYIKLVIGAYKKKQMTNELSRLLAQPTSSKIKKECLAVCKGRYEKKDEQVLNTFFRHAEQDKSLWLVIKGFDADKFKPLDNFLKGVTEKTDEKNIELLAWLINFQHRPYIHYKDFQLTDEELVLINKSTDDASDIIQDGIKFGEDGLQESEEGLKDLKNEIEGKPLLGKFYDSAEIFPEKKTPKKNAKRAMLFFLILVICTGGIYTVLHNKKDGQLMMGNMNTNCMYWANDHYEKISCNEEAKGRLMLPLNEEKMKNFKMITKEDTITEKSIGVVYYLSTNSKKEYFTQGGNHPIQVTRNLKVLTRYIYDKYFAKKTAEKDSLVDSNTKLISNR